MYHMLQGFVFALIVLFISPACRKNMNPSDTGNNGVLVSEILPGSHRMGAYMDKLKGKAVGLVVNHTSTVGERHLVDTLLSSGVNVRAIFTPEHGLSGLADAGESVADGMYKGNIPVFSLYGSSKKPSPESLTGLDLMVFDIQDVGIRFYTYISTLHYVMESAAESNIPLMVLDRPNPNGYYIDGPIREEGLISFVGMHPVPVVYGMTIGEYALMMNGERWLKDGIQANVEVIPCLGYDHSSRYVLPVAPSPNLPNERAVLLYPSLCLFEGTVFSVGRGTTKQFQLFGHPEYRDTGFSFTPVVSPGAKNPKHQDRQCYGEDLTSLDPEEIRQWGSINLGYLLKTYRTFKDDKRRFFNENNFFDKLAGTELLRQQIIQGLNEEEIKASWQNGLSNFLGIRSKYLLYDDFKS